jgi:hypothetical protein
MSLLDKVKWGHHNAEYIKKLRAMSDQDLFDEMVYRAVPDSHDGAHTGFGQFQMDASEIVYRERRGYAYRPDGYGLFDTLMWPEGMSRYEYMTS